MKRTLMVVASNKVVKDYIVESISDILGSVLDIKGFSKEERQVYENMPDLILSSGYYSDEVSAQMFPGVPIITATRVLTGVNLEQVLAIPPNQRVLVVSKPEQPTRESIELLQQAGITHIEYDCFIQGQPCDYSQYQYAITPGMGYVCPYHFPHLIDLGQRAISVQSFVQILQFFHLDYSYADAFESRYFREHILTCRKVVQALDRSEQLLGQQRFILDEMDAGIVAVDSERRLLFSNAAAHEMFPSARSILDNTDLQRVMDRMDREPVSEGENDTGKALHSAEIILKAQDITLLCHRSVLQAEQTQTYYTFRRTDKIQAMEQSVRRKLQNRGNVARYRFSDIWGSGEQSRRTLQRARAFAATEQTVLILGESGTGKEMLAQSIHNLSSRADKPFVAVNLASMSETLIESELFGYQEGAFTGARRGGKAGLLEVANEGTIFLDEIGDAPPAVQVLLLRVLEERTITRVGGLYPIPINVRVIAATNRPLQSMIKTGEFRSDLYYRLNVLSLQTAPVRDMSEEIPGFLNRYEQELFGRPVSIAPEAERLLSRYRWPGNFRELKNVAEYLYYTCGDKTRIEVSDLPEYLLQETDTPLPAAPAAEVLPPLLRETPALGEILLALSAAAPRGMGRSVLAELLGHKGFAAGEADLRRYLNALRQAGLICSGSTRQGSFLTDAGQRAVELLKQER